MQTTSRLSPAVLAARERLATGREKLKKQHAAGSPGIQVCAALTALLEAVLLDLYDAALAELEINPKEFSQHIALVPYGGFGRRDTAPFSDIDLMLLQADGVDQIVAPVVRKLTQNIYDVGIHLGFSIRTVKDACEKAVEDATIFTSLAEARFLSGSQELYDRFSLQFRRVTKRRARTLVEKIEQARRDERKQFGETNYLLEPNVKRSRGSLRDLQLIRWLGFTRCGEVEPENLVRAGLLSKEEQNRIVAARDFLLQLRNELHFHAGKANDVLNKSEQLRIAKLLEYPGKEGVLPVEQFMQDYFRHTSDVRYIAANFAAMSKPAFSLARLLEPVFGHRADGDFFVGPKFIRATRRGLKKVCDDPAEVLRLMELSNLYDKRIDHRTWAAIRDAMMSRPTLVLSPTAAERFLALLSQPPRLGELLRRLHELRVLEKIIPGMSHARCLLQFNEYHRYTVDEHSIRVVECCTDFRRDTGTLGQVYNEIKQKNILHLACLIHDLGKGYPEDHSEVGRRLAEETGKFLGLPQRDTETLMFLVHKHLVMSHLAQWRDINDDRVVVQFAIEVGSPDVLRMLYVLTCADVAGVGPGVLNDWKQRLFTDLYHRAMSHIGGESEVGGKDARLEARRAEVTKAIPESGNREWWDKHVAALPRSYLLSVPPDRLVTELEKLRQLPHNDAVAWGRQLPQQKAVEYTVGTYDEITPGIFHKLTGVLSSKGLQILSAEINTLADGMVLDRFYVTDTHYSQEPPPERLAEVSHALAAVLKDPTSKPPAFAKVWNSQANAVAQFSQMKTQVRLDNNTSERYTIVDVFTLDRMGLLYTITRTLFELGLSVCVAKIGTHLDQVVDVFYVTNQAGQKITDEKLLQEIRSRLLTAIESMGAP